MAKKVLIVEDEFTSRKILEDILSPYGQCDMVVDGNDAIKIFKLALKENDPYNLICMDIMMPKMDGQQALKEIRKQGGFDAFTKALDVVLARLKDKSVGY